MTTQTEVTKHLWCCQHSGWVMMKFCGLFLLLKGKYPTFNSHDVWDHFKLILIPLDAPIFLFIHCQQYLIWQFIEISIFLIFFMIMYDSIFFRCVNWWAIKLYIIKIILYFGFSFCFLLFLIRIYQNAAGKSILKWVF